MPFSCPTIHFYIDFLCIITNQYPNIDYEGKSQVLFSLICINSSQLSMHRNRHLHSLN